MNNLSGLEDGTSLTSSVFTALSLSSSTVSVYAWVDGFQNNISYLGHYYKTLIFVGSGWSWNQPPMMTFKDSFTVAWVASTGLQLTATNSGASYYLGYNDTYAYDIDSSDEAFNDRSAGLNGITFKFDVMRDYIPSAGIYNYAKRGYSLNTLASTDDILTSFTHNILYLHTTLSLSPTVRINPSGSISPTALVEKASTRTSRTDVFYK